MIMLAELHFTLQNNRFKTMTEGNSGGKRPKRRVKIKTEVPLKVPRRWKQEEMETLLECIMEHGHKNLNKIKERLPGRSLENIKTFMRTVFDTAGKLNEKHPTLDGWIDVCGTNLLTENWRDSFQIAQVLKYLSVDGLLEKHPLPERCEGIDFGSAYRFIYQSIMGYPIQPVNQATLDFIHQTIGELNKEIKEQEAPINSLKSFLINQSENQGGKCDVSVPVKVKIEEPKGVTQNVNKLPRVYQRKKPQPKPVAQTGITPLKIVIEEGSENSSSYSLKDFSVKFEGCKPIVVNVPVPVVDNQKKIDKDEEELLKTSSYNPFQIPEKWLEEPLYKSLLQKPHQ